MKGKIQAFIEDIIGSILCSLVFFLLDAVDGKETKISYYVIGAIILLILFQTKRYFFRESSS